MNNAIILTILLSVQVFISYGQKPKINLTEMFKGDIKSKSYSTNLYTHIKEIYGDSGVMRSDLLDKDTGTFNIDTLEIVIKKSTYKLSLLDPVFRISEEISFYMKKNNLKFQTKSDTIFVLHKSLASCVGFSSSISHVKSNDFCISYGFKQPGAMVIIEHNTNFKINHIIYEDLRLVDLLYRWDENYIVKETLRYIPDYLPTNSYNLCTMYRFIIKNNRIISRNALSYPNMYNSPNISPTEH